MLSEQCSPTSPLKFLEPHNPKIVEFCVSSSMRQNCKMACRGEYKRLWLRTRRASYFNICLIIAVDDKSSWGLILICIESEQRHPTDPFTNLELPNPSLHAPEIHTFLRSPDLGGYKSMKVPVGQCRSAAVAAIAVPDWPFHNFCASKSVYRRFRIMLSSLKDGFWGYRIVKG